MGSNILVAEDDADLRSLLQHALEADGHVVVLAADGREALEIYRRTAPDLLVLDVMMPRLSGFEVLRELRESGQLRPESPVLVLTARSSEGDVLSGFDLGAADYMTKPFILSELRARVKLLLARASGKRAPPA
jgi:DNA-binding response OmpR family regulator